MIWTLGTDGRGKVAKVKMEARPELIIATGRQRKIYMDDIEELGRKMENNRGSPDVVCNKGPFINYVRVSRGEGLEKSLHTLTWGRRSNPFLCNIFQFDILY